MPTLRFIFFVLLVKISIAQTFAYESMIPLSNLEDELKDQKIALVSIDVEVTQITGTQSRDANVIWSVNARKNIIRDLDRLISHCDINQSAINALAAANDNQVRQSIALQSIINLSILGHIQSPLPSKQDFDWSVGDQLKILKQYVDADLGLFLFIRAGYTADQSIAEHQAGFVSLVDLDSGKTVWFDHHLNISGDFRDAEKVSDAMGILMRDFPGVDVNAR